MMERKDTIRILNLNIEYGASINRGYWQYITSLWKYVIPHNIFALKTVAKFINHWNADICTFVEVDGGSFRTMNINYLKKLANMTILKKWFFFPVRHLFNLSNQGNGILTRYDILETNNYKLITHGENRYLSHVIIRIDEKIVNVFITQLALGKKSRKYELRQIADIIKKTRGPIILAGDLNTSNEYELKEIENTGLKRVETQKTFPSWNPRRTIDYIFYSDDFEVIEKYSIDNIKISDHLIIVAELRFKK
ncbi:MAG: endonuclease [Candidatus Woesearchaeota archaeon]|nr:MAG: endonuclease [Candidatus Woesearchaeota archaeon]